MTLRDLYRIQTSIASLLSAEMDVRVSYRLRHFARAVRQEIRDAEEMRMGLIRKHSPAGPLQQGTPAFAAFEAEWQEVLDSFIELPRVHVTVEELDSARVVCGEPDKATSRRKFLVAEIDDLEFLISNDPPEPKK